MPIYTFAHLVRNEEPQESILNASPETLGTKRLEPSQSIFTPGNTDFVNADYSNVGVKENI